MISISTDFITDKGCPLPHLKLIAQAGFKKTHWVHHWNDDFVYTPSEVAQIGEWLKELGLSLHGIHASAGQEKCWHSVLECQRKAGVELVVNRLEMAAKLSTDFIVLHAPLEACDSKEEWLQAFKSLEELEPVAKKLGVAIAVENMCNDDFAGIDNALARFSPDFLGICYDAGHGNVGRRDGLEQIAKRASRLLALHIHDNNSFRDQHKLPFTASLDWEAFAKTIAKTPCRDRINLEVLDLKLCPHDAPVFLKKAFDAASRIEEMVRLA